MTSHQSHKEQNSVKKWLKKLTKPIFFDEIALEVIVCNFAAIFVQGEMSE